MGILEGLAWGALGGFFVELRGLFRLRQQAPENLPSWLRGTFYWVVTFGMILSGGILVIAYLRSNVPITPILAINVGASAPAFISFLGQTTRLEPGRAN